MRLWCMLENRAGCDARCLVWPPCLYVTVLWYKRRHAEKRLPGKRG